MNPRRTYYLDGRLRDEEWTVAGLPHRKGGPAFINYYPSGAINLEAWYNAGRLHREDGPARVHMDESGRKISQGWYSDGVLHRLDGPASIVAHEAGGFHLQWYIHGTAIGEFHDCIQLIKNCLMAFGCLPSGVREFLAKNGITNVNTIILNIEAAKRLI